MRDDSFSNDVDSLRWLMQQAQIPDFRTLANRAGVSEQEVEQLWQGQIQQLSLDTLVKLSQTLRVQLAEFLAILVVDPVFGTETAVERSLLEVKELVQGHHRLLQFMKATQTLNQSSLDLDEVIARIMNAAKELMQVDRSTLWLLDEERQQLWTKIQFGDELREIRIPHNAGFAGLVTQSGEPLLIPFDLYQDPRSAISQETDRKTGYRTCSLLCMPVFDSNSKLMGVMQLINKKQQGNFLPYNPAHWPEAPECWQASFNRYDQEVMAAFNLQVGIVLQNAQQFAAVKHQTQLHSSLHRYMTPTLVEELRQSGKADLKGDRQEASILFANIWDFSSITETLTPEETVGMLNEYFELMVDAVFQHQGTLDKYLGDTLMAVFGAPLPLADHAWLSVQTSLTMRQRLAVLNDRRQGVGQPEIQIGIGIHSDSVISGNMGSSRRQELTAIGDGVNLSSRLEGASKIYGCGIIISESTYAPCADRIWVRELDYIRVKGKEEPVSIYELIGLRSEPLSPERQQLIELYHQGREHYLNRKFALAVVKFAEVLEINRFDKAAACHLERCNYFLQNPPPEDWVGRFGLLDAQ